MVNKCVVDNCYTGHLTGPRKAIFSFPEDPDLRKRWIYFVNRKDWQPTKHSVICIDHFDEKYINPISPGGLLLEQPLLNNVFLARVIRIKSFDFS